MDEKQGVLIVIEGADGSGKATQLKLVKERMEAAGYEVATFDFPRYDLPSSYFVRRYLNGDYGKSDEVGPYTSSLFFALDRFEAASDIRKALGEGKIVLSDRFTGSNMAHQGTKIANSEQRRGFFIWLDNLEFEMLRIPRPDISFVLRVPAEISHALLEGKKRDIHEADLTHMQRAVSVYDEMTELFPKDFQRVDCVRGGELLDIETINNMLWEKISPLLPQPIPSPRPKAEPTESTASAKTDEPITESAPKPTTEPYYLVLENASGLLAQKVERIVDGADLESPDIPSIYVPDNLVPDAKKEYEEKMSTLLGLYAKLIAGLAKHGISAQESRQTASSALPVGMTQKIKIPINSPWLDELIISLMNDPLTENQSAGASLFAQAIKINPGRFKDSIRPTKITAPAAVRALAEEFLSENHIGDQPMVQLTAVWPRNETDLVADMLYEHSSLPLRTIQNRIAAWSINRRLAVFESYIGDGQPGPALEKAHYAWDLLSPYNTFRELQTHPLEALEVQALTPRYGYEMPELIEEAGLSDTYEKCFDLSLGLYSRLQQAGHQTEAQYATLCGHKQRWSMCLNAAEFIHLTESEHTPDTQNLLSKMKERLAEAHPIIGELMAKEN